MLSVVVRLVNINNPKGLWYDEMVTYIFASERFPLGILKTLWQQEYHMPLYYLFIHVWMKLFGSSDFILRMSSLLFGVLTVPALFILGKTYRSEKLGLLLSFFGCLSPILIYYSQEFRFYSMLIFLSTISLTCFLKLTEKFDKRLLLAIWITNLIILYIYTMGIVFVAAEAFLLFLNSYLYDKANLKILIKYSIVLTIFTIPYFILLGNFIYGSNKAFVDPFGWGQSGIYSLTPWINDYFSPYISSIYGHHYFTLFSIVIPLLFAICFIKGLREHNKKLYYLMAILLVFLLTVFSLCLLGYMALTSRYTLVVLPIIFLICIDGLLMLKSKFIKYVILCSIFFVFTFSFISISFISHTSRPDGIKYPADFIQKLNPKGDYLIASEGTNLFKKYIKNVNFIDFDSHKVIHLDKTKKENIKIFDESFIKETTKHNSVEQLVPYFLNNEPTMQLQTFINKQIVKIPKGKRLIFVEGPNYYGEMDAVQLREYTNQYTSGLVSQKDFKNSMFYLLNRKIDLDLQKTLKNNLSLITLQKKHISADNKHIRCSWTITVYKRI